MRDWGGCRIRGQLPKLRRNCRGKWRQQPAACRVEKESGMGGLSGWRRRRVRSKEESSRLCGRTLDVSKVESLMRPLVMFLVPIVKPRPGHWPDHNYAAVPSNCPACTSLCLLSFLFCHPDASHALSWVFIRLILIRVISACSQCHCLGNMPPQFLRTS